MSDKSAIEWTDATWNPVTGCTKVSPGCDHCYAETFAERFRGTPGHHFEQGFDLILRPERLDQPLQWKRPRRIFVNSMSDLFHDDIPDSFVAEVFATMALAEQHTFQVLTKRHGRMRSLLRSEVFQAETQRRAVLIADRRGMNTVWAARMTDPADGPARNVWLGVSVENQQWADIRIPALLDTPAAVRWLSCEPLLGQVDLSRWLGLEHYDSFGWGEELGAALTGRVGGGLGWVVVGGESGRGARPMHPKWARTIRAQCTAAGVPFHFKQFGQHAPVLDRPREGDLWVTIGGGATPWQPGDGHIREGGGDFRWPGRSTTVLVRPARRKQDAGRVLDGRTWDEYPGGGS